LSKFPEISLSVTDLGCDRGGIPVVRGLDLILSSGHAVQFFGNNGSGKSTILQTLAGLISPATGHMKWQRNGEPTSIKTHMIYVGHVNALKPALSVLENLQFWARGYGIADLLISEALEKLEIASLAQIPFGRLSAGQQRRANLARCVMAGRFVWLLDEPTTALDQQGHYLVSTLLDEHLQAGGMAIVATHKRLDIASIDIHISPAEVAPILPVDGGAV